MTSRTKTFDVLIATDCRFPGGNTSSVVEEIEAQYRAGYRTGVLHLPSPILNRPRPFASKMRSVLENGRAELVLGADRVETGLLLARHPTVFTDPPRDLPTIEAEHVVLAVNQVAADDRGVLPYYDIPHVHRQIRSLLGTEATWAPIGPRVRQSLEEYAETIPLLPWDWENVIDVTRWHVERTGFVSDRPVIGRHSRGHWTKWPATKRDILAAYPADPRYSVRILGGTQAPEDILDRIPLNWVDLPFNSVPPWEFLATIDFFVYFHHPGLVEAFGRVVLEALSAGAVVIAPSYLEPLFGDVCLYGTPQDVRPYVDQLFGDWDAFAGRSRAGVELTQKRFSYETHVERIISLIGDPSAPPDPIGRTPQVLADSHPSGRPFDERHPAADGQDAARHGGTLVVDLRRDTGESTLLPSVLTQIGSLDDRPCAAVVPARRIREVGTSVATSATPDQGDDPAGVRTGRNPTRGTLVETLPDVTAELSDRDLRQYVGLRLSGLIDTHRPARVVVLDGDRRDVDVVLAAMGDATLDLLLVHPRTAAPPLDGSDLGWSLPGNWTVTRAPGRRSAPSHAPKGAWAKLRRKAPMPLRSFARRTMSTVRRNRVRALERFAPWSGLMLFEAGEAEVCLPVRAPVTHPQPDQVPVALVVVTGEDVDAETTLLAVVERAQMTTAFRPAVLAPPDWVDAAAGLNVTVETLVPKSQWSSVYGGDWADYLRRRVRETCQVIQPVTVALTATTLTPSGTPETAKDASAVLDALESAHTVRRAGDQRS